MKKVKVIKSATPQRYTQSSQSNYVTFSFLKKADDGVYYEMFRPCLCRDFLNTIVMYSKSYCDRMECYGMTLSDKIDSDELRLRVVTSKPDNLRKMVTILRDLEKSFGKLDRRLELVKDNHDSFVLLGDAKWQSNPLTMSILSLLLRVSANNVNIYSRKFNTYIESLSHRSCKDTRYILNVIDSINIPFLFENIDDIISDNPVTGIMDEFLDPDSFRKSSHVDFMHNSSGIISFARNAGYIKSSGHTGGYSCNRWLDNYIEKRDGTVDRYPVVEQSYRHCGNPHRIIYQTRNNKLLIEDSTGRLRIT